MTKKEFHSTVHAEHKKILPGFRQDENHGWRQEILMYSHV